MNSQAPKHIREWFSKRVLGMTAARREVATAGVEDFTEHDWRAYYELVETYRLGERPRAELDELERVEQQIMRELPQVVVTGTKYPAPWSLGLRVAAARRVWPTERRSVVMEALI